MSVRYIKSHPARRRVPCRTVPRTHGERLRAMSDKELARAYAENCPFCESCPAQAHSYDDDFNGCAQCFERWLGDARGGEC